MTPARDPKQRYIIKIIDPMLSVTFGLPSVKVLHMQGEAMTGHERLGLKIQDQQGEVKSNQERTPGEDDSR